MSGIIRDFSQQSVQELRSIIQKNADSGQWGFFDWFNDTFQMQELNIKNYLNNVNEYHTQMIDKHNMGSAEFDKILERVHSVDTNYASRFNSLGDRVTALYTRIERLTEMINPSVVTANPSDFAKLADGISSNYNKVKVESDAKMKQCEASMPVLYDKQWYENVADGVKSDLNTTGQVIQRGLVDVGKELIQGPVDIADGITDFINHDALGQTKETNCWNQVSYFNRLSGNPQNGIENFFSSIFGAGHTDTITSPPPDKNEYPGPGWPITGYTVTTDSIIENEYGDQSKPISVYENSEGPELEKQNIGLKINIGSLHYNLNLGGKNIGVSWGISNGNSFYHAGRSLSLADLRLSAGGGVTEKIDTKTSNDWSVGYSADGKFLAAVCLFITGHEGEAAEIFERATNQ